MPLSVFALVVVAAAIHALWNVWLKQSENRLLTLATMSVGWGIFGLLALPFVAPPGMDVWPYLLASIVIHIVYAMVLATSYKVGDLSVVYPIARGTGPLIVTLMAVFLLGEELGPLGMAAVALVILGVMLLGAKKSAGNYTALMISLTSGTMIGLYTLVDGLGGRMAASPHSYAAWLFMLQGPALATVVLIIDRSGFRGLAASNWPKDLVGGFISVLAYWIAIWAMSVAPLPLVAAVRESSVAFAALFGGLMLKERVNWPAVLLILAGVLLIRLAGSQ